MIRVGGLCAFKTTGFSSAIDIWLQFKINRHILAASNSDFSKLVETKYMTESPCMAKLLLGDGFVALHIWLRWVKQYTQSCSVLGVPNIRMFYSFFLHFLIAAWFLHLTVYAQRMMCVLSLCRISYMHVVKQDTTSPVSRASLLWKWASGTLWLCLVDNSSPQLHTPLGTNTSNLSLPLISTLF